LPGGWAGVRRALRSIAVSLNAAVIAGALVGGLGGRLFMRVLAATSPDTLHGVRTEAEQPIGRVTTGGTIGLVVFGGILGALAVAIVHRVLRRWLPRRGWQAGLVSAWLAFALLSDAADLLDPGSKDFDILSPRWLAVTMIIALVALFGVVFGTVYERLDRATPEIRASRAALAYIPVAVLMLPGAPGLVMLAVVGLAAAGSAAINAWHTNAAVTRIGRYLVGAGAAAATVASVARAAEILG
jgi:hypothetical protein